MSTSYPIGIFDSGLGGLTVMRALIDVFPHTSMVYYGDTARVPYGEKSPETIIRYAIEITGFLMKQNIKRLVVACNTVSAYALPALRDRFNIPITGVIEPGAQSAAQATKSNQIAILGTKATIASDAYQKELHRLLPDVKLFPIACPLFVPLVEENFMSHPASHLIIREYLKPLERTEVDSILLGCTHYPLLKKEIKSQFIKSIKMIDSASVTALSLKEQIEDTSHCPQYIFYSSDDPERFRHLAGRFLGREIDQVLIPNKE